jgi:hypothetical protein
MNVNELIKQRREELGKSRAEVAEAAAIDLSTYYDVEAYPDELGAVVTLGQARRLATELGVGLGAILDVPASGRGATQAAVEARERIRARRLELGRSMASTAAAQN